MPTPESVTPPGQKPNRAPAIERIVIRQADRGAVDVHDRAVLERSLGILRDSAPTLELIVSTYLAAGPGARLVVREREWGGHEARIVMPGEGETRVASQQRIDPVTAEVLRPLASG